MKTEIFQHAPQAGDYGSDWKRIHSGITLKDARTLAAITHLQTGKAIRILSLNKSIGRLLDSFGEQK